MGAASTSYANSISAISSTNTRNIIITNTSNMSINTGNIGAVACNICTNTNSIIA